MSKEKFTLTTLVEYLNKTYTKKSGEIFTTSDVQGYIRRGQLPLYLTEKRVTIITSKEIPGVTLYQLKN